MKQSSWLHRSSPIAIIYALAIPLCLYTLLAHGYKWDQDAYTYFNAIGVLNSGGIDASRPPLYPWFIEFIANMFGCSAVDISGKATAGKLPKLALQSVGASSLVCIVCIQYLVHLLSLYCFYKLSLAMLRNKGWALVATLLYVLFSHTQGWNYTILPESFVISGIVFFAYSGMRVLKDRSTLHAILLGVITLLMLFLKPTFIYLLPIIVVAAIWLFSHKGGVRAGIICCVDLVVVSAALLLYMYQFKQQYGVYGITQITTKNRYYDARYYNMIDLNKVENDTLREFFAKKMQQNPRIINRTDTTTDAFINTALIVYGEYHEAVNKTNLHEVKKVVDQALNDHKSEYVKTIIQQRFLCLRYMDVKTSPSSHEGKMRTIKIAGMIIIEFVLFAYGIALCFIFIKRKEKPWLKLFVWAIGFAHLLTSIIGGPNDHLRLLAPIYSIYILVLCDMCRWMLIKLRLEKVKKITCDD